ncbi:MAG: PASTA domain-containing protein [Clostridia bacterium]|nr:PASTA domain-containing protein [Clostridia bacterium]
MINSDNLCMSCMKDIGNEKQCPYCGFHVDSQQHSDYLPLRTVLGNRYLVGKLLEFNGDGATYMGLDLTTRETVNIREYFPLGIAVRNPKNLMVSPAEGKDRIYNEYMQSFIELWSKLMRLNGLSALIKVLNIIEGGGTCYVITENIDGVSLREHLLRNNSSGYISWEKARPMLMPVLSTLGTLHGAGIVHRGISPGTLIVANDGKIRITGFSISAVRSAQSDLEAELYNGYAAFEQYGFNSRQGPWTDIYAFGAVLYRTLIGTDPIDAKERVANDRLMIPGRFAEQLPAYVINGLVNALQILPDDRIKSVEELRDELSASPNAVAAAGQMNIDDIRNNHKAKPAPKEPSEKRIEAQKRHNRNVIAIGVAIIVVILIVAAALIIPLITGDNGNSGDDTGNTSAQEMIEVPNFTDRNSWGNFDDIIQDEYVSAHFKIEKEEVYNDHEEGTVLAQNIKSGTSIPDKSVVVLKVSKGKEQVMFPASGVIGKKADEAKKLLEDAGFAVTILTKVNSGGYEKGIVYQASLDAGQKYPKGTAVQLIVWDEVTTTTTTTTTEQSTTLADVDDDDNQGGGADWLEW